MDIFTHEWLQRNDAPNLYLTSTKKGSLKTIILVPGIGWHAGFYVQLMNRLEEEGYRVIAVDLRGHGRSEGQRGQHLYEELIEDVKDVVEYVVRNYEGDVYLFGTSFGASIAYYAAINTPHIKGLILNNAWDLNNLPSTINKKRIFTMLNKHSENPNRLIALPIIMGAKMSWSLFDNKLRFLGLLKDKLWHRKWSVQSWKSFLQYKADPSSIQNFNLPTLVLTGDQDGMLPLEYTQSVFHDLATSNKELKIIKNAGHMIMLEYLDESVPIVSKWVKSIESRKDVV
ncbi:alpha-beta hydrolase superfamily lysophospholipase [Sporosarcina luteola]|nr:alpha-beta hydrolase superfamily lysophospholipase [Sporosarcina luteola]